MRTHPEEKDKATQEGMGLEKFGHSLPSVQKCHMDMTDMLRFACLYWNNIWLDGFALCEENYIL